LHVNYARSTALLFYVTYSFSYRYDQFGNNSGSNFARGFDSASRYLILKLLV